MNVRSDGRRLCVRTVIEKGEKIGEVSLAVDCQCISLVQIGDNVSILVTVSFMS